MFGINQRQSHAVRRQKAVPSIEYLELRQMLSTSPVLHDNLKILKADQSGTSIQGYTPAQIRTAYGFNNISIAGGASADGSGQTIAIVDAFNDPTLVNDLKVFDSQFGLPAANLTIENQDGGTTLPSTDAGWAGEISLDVEWAHAIAPGAKILLVEASDATTFDLLSAVDTARNTAGVSVVSMSWGGSEFFSYGNSEASSELANDFHFTTPVNHQSETFVASAGDSGSFSGVQWPAASSNVLSVGGTSLHTADSNGTYSSESSWSGTNGGYSLYETEPSYQNSVNSTGVRAVPDVSYNADPNTGFAVYDSTPESDGTNTYVGWQVVGGTSAGSPQWSALIAIADQARVASGKTTLDGVSQTLPILYSLYTATDSSGSSIYSTYFTDIVDSTPGGYHFPFGGFGDNNNATAGFDTATGLGTPHAAAIVDAMVGVTPSTPTNPSNPTTPTEPTLPASPLVATVVSSPSGTVIGTESGTLKLRIINNSASAYSGPVSVSLYATSTGTIGSTDTAFQTISLGNIKLGADKTKIVTVHFSYPSGLSTGSYHLVAAVNALATNTTPSQTVTPALVINKPSVNLSTAFVGSQSIHVVPGHNSSASIRITNNGNVTASGSLTLRLYASADQSLDDTDTLLNTVLKSITLKPGKSITLHVRFPALASQAGGTYYLIASASSSTNPSDTVAGDKTAVIATRA